LTAETVTLGTAALPVAHHVGALHILEAVAPLDEDVADVDLILDPGALAQVFAAVGVIEIIRPIRDGHQLEHMFRVSLTFQKAVGMCPRGVPIPPEDQF
jgi:hypothetical protein